jgi:chromosome segregation ATPase
MSVSPPTASPYILDEILPSSMQERHCKVEDWFRYIGVGAGLAGTGVSFYLDCRTSGLFLTGTVVTGLIGHLIEKNCGLRARVKAAAQKALEGFQAGAVTLNVAAVRLEKIGDDRKHDTEELSTEQTALLAERRGLEESVKQMQENVMHYQAENLALKNTNEQHQQTIEQQVGLISGLERNLAQFTEQNNRVHKDLTEIPQLISSLHEADDQLVLHTKAATTGLQNGLQELETDTKNFTTKNGQLQIRIDSLQEQTAALGKARADWQANIDREQHVRTDLSGIVTKIDEGQTQLKATEHQINIELAALKEILAKRSS